MAAAASSVALVAAAVAVLAGAAHACDGYSVKNFQIKQCSDQQSGLDLTRMKPELTSKCTVKVNGCLNVSRKIEAAKVIYTAKKNAALLTRGEEDICKFLKDNKDNEYTRPILDMYNIPEECPMTPGLICGNGKEVSIKNYRRAMATLVGKYDIHTLLDYPDSTKACYDFAFDVVSPLGIV